MNSYFYDSCVRFLDKSVTACEQNLFNNWWSEQIAMYGQSILYYVNNLSLSAMDPSFGEDTPAKFSDPQPIIAVVDLTQTQIFSKWALMGDDFTTIIIPITSFQDTFGANAEPKSGDIFQLSEFGEGRPGGRNGIMFEITERLDQDVTLINPLMSHVVWKISAKRYQFTYEPGVSSEAVTDQVVDSGFMGRLSGGENPTTTNNYPVESVDDIVQNEIFNYTLSAGRISDQYGGY